MSDVVNQFNTLDSSTKQQIYKDLRIVGLAADDSACGHYRMVNPLTYLNSLGARCEWYNYSRPDMVEWADIVITQRSYDRVLQTDVLNRLGKMGKTIIYEIDDNLHCVDPDSHAFGVFHPGSPELTAAGRNMADCDGMTVSTLELAGMYQSMNPNIRYVPNAIDFEMRDWEYVPPEKDPRFIYLGISGGLTHTPDWKDFDVVVKPLLDKYKNVKLALYTGKQMIDFLMNRWQLDMDRVEIVPPQSFHDYPKNLGWFDIGLGPLKNIRFNSAKSNLRILEWAAKRIPGVFSVSAAYSTTIRNGVNGFTASSKDEWIDKTSYLIENEDARRQMGDVGYQMVRDHFDQANIVHEWVKAWKGIQDVVVGKRVPPTYRSYFGNLERNEPCPCGSGLKYKKCQCAGAFG